MKPVVFIHIPKTAGSTVLGHLEQHYDTERALRVGPDAATAHDPVSVTGLLDKLRQYDFVTGHLPFWFVSPLAGGVEFLTVLRRPVDRVVSLYEFLRRLPEPSAEHERFAWRLARTLDVLDFVTCDHPEIRSQLVNGMCHQLQPEPPGDGWSVDRLIGRARESLLKMHFGLVERLDDTFDLWQSTLGFRRPAVVSRVNARPRASRRHRLSARVRRAVVSRNTGDLALYEEAVALFDQRVEEARDRDLRNDGAFSESVPALVPGGDSAFEWAATRPVCGDGWYQAEYTAEGLPYRFSGPTRRASLWLRVPPLQAAVLQLVVVIFADDRMADVLRLFVDGRLLSHRQRMVPGVGLVIETDVQAAELARGLVKLEVDTGFVMRPQVRFEDSLDDRLLGLGLHQVRLVPVPEGGGENRVET